MLSSWSQFEQFDGCCASNSNSASSQVCDVPISVLELLRSMYIIVYLKEAETSMPPSLMLFITRHSQVVG